MSFTTELNTDNESVRLIAPDVERDAELAMGWLKGEVGKSTLTLMGNVPDTIPEEPSLYFEKQRVSEFLENDNEYNWMIEFEGKVVGSVWADLEPSEYVPAPSVHIMIGDSEVRGQGIGPNAMNSVIKYLKDQGKDAIYSRHLVANTGAASLLEKLQFTDLGKPYLDNDRLLWQNTILDTRSDEQK